MNELKNNPYLAFDLIVLISLLIAAYSGFKLGFLQSLFKGIGYITGGVIGVSIATNYLNNLDSIIIKVLSSLIIILLSAVILQYVLGRIGLLLHKGLLFAPFKSIDSLFGSLLLVVKTVVIYYIISTLLLSNSWNLADDFIGDSKFYSAFLKYFSEISICRKFLALY